MKNFKFSSTIVSVPCGNSLIGHNDNYEYSCSSTNITCFRFRELMHVLQCLVKAFLKLLNFKAKLECKLACLKQRMLWVLVLQNVMYGN